MKKDQAELTCSVDELDGLISYFSPERLAGYFVLVRSQGDEESRKREAIRLYGRNTEISEALYGVMQGFEVAFRNAVHNKLVSDHGESWFDSLSFWILSRALLPLPGKMWKSVA